MEDNRKHTRSSETVAIGDLGRQRHSPGFDLPLCLLDGLVKQLTSLNPTFLVGKTEIKIKRPYLRSQGLSEMRCTLLSV